MTNDSLPTSLKWMLNAIPSEPTALSRLWPGSRYNDAVESQLNKLLELGLVELKTTKRTTRVYRVHA